MANSILGPISDKQNQHWYQKVSVQETAAYAYAQDSSAVEPQATVVYHFRIFSELQHYDHEGTIGTCYPKILNS